MPPRTATVPQNAQPFTFDGAHYGPGDAFSDEDPCRILAFAEAYQAANPDGGTNDGSPNFWQSMREACPAGTGTTPGPSAPSAPDESNQSSIGDSAQSQGAPAPTGPIATGAGTSDAATPAPAATSDDGEEPRRPPTGQVDPAQVRELPQAQVLVSDPVDVFSGAYVTRETDLEIPGTLLPLAFVRLYRSGTPAFGPLGWNWDHNFNVYLRELASGDVALWRSLHEDVFAFDGVRFEPPRGVFELLERVPGVAEAWTLRGVEGSILRFERPADWVDDERIPLVSIQDRHGNTLRLAYGEHDTLAEVRDDDDRFLALDYDDCGLLVAVSDHAGRRYDYTHDEQTFHLLTVTTPPTTDHPDGITRAYHYADPDGPPELRHNIVRVEDGCGRVFLENTYEEDPSSLDYARITEQLFGAYLYQYRHTQLQAVPAAKEHLNVAAEQVEVMNPDFGVETYTFNFRGDLLDERLRLVRDHSFRVVALQYAYDEQGNRTATTKPDGSQELAIYDAADADPRMRGLLLRRELTAAAGFPAPSRIVWRGHYEPVYQLLVEETAENGAVTSYDYDLDLTPGAATNTGKLKRVRHPHATLPDGTMQTSATRYEHAPTGQLTAIVAPDGTRTELAYGTVGPDARRLVRTTHDAGGLELVEAYEYDAFGYRTATVDPAGNRREQRFNALGQIERTLLPAVGGIVAEQTIHYDEDRRVSSFERPRGDYDDAQLAGAPIADTFARDVLGNPVECLLAANTATPRRVRSQFDHRGCPLVSHYPDGSRIERIYDERGMLIEELITGADGTRARAREHFDRSGNRTRTVAAGGVTTTYERDGFNRLRRIVAPNGTETALTWGAGDVLRSMRVTGADDQGVVRLLAETRWQYDERLRRVREVVRSFDDDPAAAVDATTTFFHDEAGRLVRTVDQRGATTTWVYDALGRPTAAVDPVGNELRRAYDAAGNVVLIRRRDVEPDGSASTLDTRFAFDERNRRTATIAPDGSRRAVAYDDRDLPIAETDAAGVRTEIAYDAFGSRTAETRDPGGSPITHRWELDALGRTTAYVDPTGAVTTYALDGLGRRVAMTLPNGFSSTRTFDEAGNALTEELAGGARFAFDYDTANRLTRIHAAAAPAGTATVPDHEFAYDGLDRMVLARCEADEVARRYDSRGRLRLERSGGVALERSFDDLAGTLTRRWPDGRTERVATDLAGRPTTFEEIASGALGVGAATIATLAASGPDRAGTAVLGGGLRVAATYDERKRLVELAASSAGGVEESVAYRYDVTDRRRVESLGGGLPSLRSFELDDAARMTVAARAPTTPLPAGVAQAEQTAAIAAVRAAAAGGAAEGFAYDAADARVRATRTGLPDRVYVNDAGHRPLTAGPEAFAYDADGVRSSDGQFSYVHDALGRVVAVTAGAATACEIAYDALGRPAVLREQGGPARSLHWFGAHVEQESEGAAAVRQSTLHPSSGVALAHHVSGATHIPLHDGRANLVALVDAGGALLERYRYAPFGEPAIFDADGGQLAASAFGQPPVFGGQRHLPSVGLYLSTRRLMDPRHGVFLSPDPLGYALSPSLYAYAAQDPLDLADPDGEFAFLAILAVMAVGAIVAGALNASRQGIQMAENPARRAEGFSWGELFASMGIGAVVAPIVAAVPELAVPLAGLGVAGGGREIANGNVATGMFDIVTAVAPFGVEEVATANVGRGTYIGQAYGLGPAVPLSARGARFAAVEQNFGAFAPAPGGRRVGIGFAHEIGDPAGHTGVIVDEGEGFTLFHKNAQRTTASARSEFGVDTRLMAAWRAKPPPSQYFNGRAIVPFEYESMRVSRPMADALAAYARRRISQPEPFEFGTRSCGNFTSDALAAGGIRGMASPDGAGGVYRNFTGLLDATNMTYASGFWSSAHATVPNRKCVPGAP